MKQYLQIPKIYNVAAQLYMTAKNINFTLLSEMDVPDGLPWNITFLGKEYGPSKQSVFLVDSDAESILNDLAIAKQNHTLPSFKTSDVFEYYTDLADRNSKTLMSCK